MSTLVDKDHLHIEWIFSGSEKDDRIDCAAVIIDYISCQKLPRTMG
ncbi:MAG: hypothetical protein SV375_09115 [Thermodesulfobacteriota bacterium]|nr:hypothetical protein [Thermodesulfobacteriota bacterium]